MSAARSKSEKLDLPGLKRLKLSLLEADVGAHQDRLDGVRIASEQFTNAGHFDAENIRSKYDAVNNRY